MMKQAARDYQRIEKVLQYLESMSQEQPDLVMLSSIAELSPFHFQRLFKRWVGLSPKQCLALLTIGHAKRLLDESKSLLETSLEVGLSGPSRLHDLFIKVDAMTPGEYKEKGRHLNIRYGFHPSPFGECCIGTTERGICRLSFIGPQSREEHVQELERDWSLATLQKDTKGTSHYLTQIFEPKHFSQTPSISLLLKGTPFQIKVWEALMRIPKGALVSYEAIAKSLQKPTAQRAVANAVGDNPIGYLIPCHRVIRKMGGFGGYRTGLPRKKAMLAQELIERY